MGHIHKRGVSSLVLCCLFGLLAACSGATTDIGVIGRVDQAVITSLPEIAKRDEAIQLTFNTYGDSCTAATRTEVQLQGLEATVTPYDTKTTGTSTSPCVLVAFRIEHTATLVFDQVGTATVTVRGYDTSSDFGGKVIEVVRTITIQ